MTEYYGEDGYVGEESIIGKSSVNLLWSRKIVNILHV